MKFLLALISLSIPLFSNPSLADRQTDQSDSLELCQEVSQKLRTISFDGCLGLDLHSSDFYSAEKRPLMFREVTPSHHLAPEGRILFIGGIHGDEYTSVSITYLWLRALLEESVDKKFHWLFLPFANPDGLMRTPGTRTNGNGVDLNRNFPTPDWNRLAMNTWKNRYKKNKRRYPGPFASSEVETQWMVKTIEFYQPDAIIAIHAPYGLLDYDGPEHAQPNQIGGLKLRPLGTYPGSLGRYAGEYLNIPVLTVELDSANRMPNTNEIMLMLNDMENWVSEKIEQKEIDF